MEILKEVIFCVFGLNILKIALFSGFGGNSERSDFLRSIRLRFSKKRCLSILGGNSERN